MSADEQRRVLNNLEGLLEKQVELARKGKISDVEVLCEQAGSLLVQVAEARTLELPEFADYRGRFVKLYEELCFVLSTQKAQTGEELSRIRKSKKTMETYRANI